MSARQALQRRAVQVARRTVPWRLRGRLAKRARTVVKRYTSPLVTVVVTTPHAAGAAEFVDGDYLAPLRQWARSVLDTAREHMPSGVAATFEVHEASSIPGGLLELATRTNASALVLGSSSKGAMGRISLGSVTDRLVHSAPLPVLLAPLGYLVASATLPTAATWVPALRRLDAYIVTAPLWASAMWSYLA